MARRKQSKKQAKASYIKAEPDPAGNYVLYGFEKANIGNTGFLAFDKSNPMTIYKIVDDIHDAAVFKSGSNKKSSKATPAAWCELINKDFSSWMFHLVKTSF
jgi:hypothetical protein